MLKIREDNPKTTSFCGANYTTFKKDMSINIFKEKMTDFLNRRGNIRRQ